jgi:hypothetical protein
MATTDTSTDFPAGLIVEPGQTVEARYRRAERGFTTEGKEGVIVILKLDGEERSWWPWDKAARGQLRKAKPVEGELLRISRGAEKKLGSNGYRYWPWKIVTPEREPETLDWDDPLWSESKGADKEPGDEADDDFTPYW